MITTRVAVLIAAAGVSFFRVSLLVFWAAVLLGTVGSKSAVAQTLGRPYFMVSAGALLVHSKRALPGVDQSTTFYNYELPGLQLEMKYGGSVNEQSQLELVGRFRYAGYSSVAVQNATLAPLQVLVNNSPQGRYVAATFGPQLVYSFQPRNRLFSNDQEEGGPYIFGGMGFSFGNQTTVMWQARPLSSSAQTVLDIIGSRQDFVFAPYASVGAGYEVISEIGLKVNFSYGFDFEMNVMDFGSSVMIHNLSLSLRF